MSYSSIVRKKCKCGECDRYPDLGFKGYSRFCRPDLVEEKLKQSKERQKKKNAITLDQRKLRKEDNKLLDGKAAMEFEKLQQFFVEVAKIIDKKPHCWECGAFIPKRYYRAATAHVLPKRANFGFPSIAANADNFLILGAGCGCHSKYDSTWEQAAQMRVFPIAVTKFLNLYPFIAKEEKKNIPEIFLQELEVI